MTRRILSSDFILASPTNQQKWGAEKACAIISPNFYDWIACFCWYVWKCQ